MLMSSICEKITLPRELETSFDHFTHFRIKKISITHIGFVERLSPLCAWEIFYLQHSKFEIFPPL
jgi:hypothetical protein